MLEIVNQLDGFDSRGNIKASLKLSLNCKRMTQRSGSSVLSILAVPFKALSRAPPHRC